MASMVLTGAATSSVYRMSISWLVWQHVREGEGIGLDWLVCRYVLIDIQNATATDPPIHRSDPFFVGTSSNSTTNY